MADIYGFEAEPYEDESSNRNVRRKLGLGPIAGTTGPTYTPISSSAAALQSRPTKTTQEQKGTSESVSEISFTGERPADFQKPEWDVGEIKKRTAEISGPKVRQLRQALNQALVKHYENPNVRKMMVRSALQGYGIGLGNVTAAAATAARSEYAQKYSFDMSAAMANFNAAWREYMGARKTTTAGTTTGTGVTDYTYFGSPEEEYTGPAVLKPPGESWNFGGITGGMIRY